MAFLLDTSKNLSFYTIPAAWVIAIIPHFMAAGASKKFDNRSPRNYTKTLESDQTIDQATKDYIVRLESAQQNGFENVGLFAAAVVAGNISGVSTATLNTLSIGYLASRIVYNYVYATGTSETTANVRSAVFLSGIVQIMTLFIKSGNLVRERVVAGF